MKFYYLDAENIGQPGIEQVSFELVDRVFVFTNSPVIQAECKHPSMVVLGGYPTGANQADFYIIAHLANVLAHVERTQKKKLEFILMSRDRSLCMAFEYQCVLAGVNCAFPLLSDPAEEEAVQRVVAVADHTAVKTPALTSAPNKPSAAVKPVVASQKIQDRILQILSKPMSFETMRKCLSQPKEAVIGPFNQLIHSGLIKRQPQSKKLWMRVEL